MTRLYCPTHATAARRLRVSRVMNRVNLGIAVATLVITAAAVVRALLTEWAPFWPFSIAGVVLAVCALGARHWSLKFTRLGAVVLATETPTCAECQAIQKVEEAT